MLLVKLSRDWGWTGIKRFGLKFLEIMSVIEQRANGANVSPYDAKNASLRLSLFVGSYFSYAKWIKIFEWLERENIDQPERILDLGCECGFTTCLLSFLWPYGALIPHPKNEFSMST